MTATAPERFERAFRTHDAYEREPDDGFRLTTTTFEARVTAARTDADGETLAYAVTVRAPMLSTAVEAEVGPAVEDGWFDTYALRLGDAAGAVRADVAVEHDVRVVEGDAVATFRFEWDAPGRAPAVAKALAEYAEGTYVEGVVPGYEYGEPVASMLAQATQGEGGDRGGTPL